MASEAAPVRQAVLDIQAIREQTDPQENEARLDPKVALAGRDVKVFVGLLARREKLVLLVTRDARVLLGKWVPLDNPGQQDPWVHQERAVHRAA